MRSSSQRIFIADFEVIPLSTYNEEEISVCCEFRVYRKLHRTSSIENSSSWAQYSSGIKPQLKET